MATLSVDPHLSTRTANFVNSDHRMLIDGRFVAAASGKTFPGLQSRNWRSHHARSRGRSRGRQPRRNGGAARF